MLVVDVRSTGVPPVSFDPTHGRDARATLESIYHALVLGLRDYVRKCGFSSVVIGLSGGIDSALTAALAVDALGKDKVTGAAMPSRFSSEHSIADAWQLAKNLGIEFHVVSIKSIHDAYEQTLGPVFALLPLSDGAHLLQIIAVRGMLCCSAS